LPSVAGDLSKKEAKLDRTADAPATGRAKNEQPNAPPERKVRIVALHSFRGGTGKSNLAANLGYLAAREGARVAVLDADLQSPGVHVIFGVETGRMMRSLSDCVQGQCDLQEVALDLTSELGLDAGGGKLLLLPSSLELEAITAILSKGYEVARLNEEVLHLCAELGLDYLVLDTHPGLNRETLLSLAIADTVLILVRPDRQDFQGTSVLVEVASKLAVPNILFVANKVLDDQQASETGVKIEETFGFPLAGTLPLCEELMRLGSSAIFARQHERHPFTGELERLAQRILPVPVGAGGKS
jgi:MinD-like ATPase involved in chromosome partitioning or flagellar assembly